MSNSLEGIEGLLPSAVALDPDLYTAEDHLFSAAEVYSELDDIAILDLERLALLIGLAQSYVIQEGARGALYVFDPPLSVLAPQLAVFPAYDFGLEADSGGGRHVLGHLGHHVPLGIATDLDGGRLVG